MFNELFMTRFVAHEARFVAGSYMLQRSDARLIHSLRIRQGTEQGTKIFSAFIPFA